MGTCINYWWHNITGICNFTSLEMVYITLPCSHFSKERNEQPAREYTCILLVSTTFIIAYSFHPESVLSVECYSAYYFLLWSFCLFLTGPPYTRTTWEQLKGTTFLDCLWCLGHMLEKTFYANVFLYIWRDFSTFFSFCLHLISFYLLLLSG